jgi:ribosomal protein S18 acetylase RimI-like enzyme
MNLPTDLAIRLGEPKDSLALSKIATKLFKQTYNGKMPSKDLESYVREDFGYDQQLAELEDVNVTTLLVEYGDGLVGYAQIRRKSIPVEIDSNVILELWRIYLDQSRRGLGIGKLLLSRVGEAVRAMSSDQVWLGVWEQNNSAISFYQKHGFRVVGSQEFHIGNEVHNDLIMLGSANAF